MRYTILTVPLAALLLVGCEPASQHAEVAALDYPAPPPMEVTQTCVGENLVIESDRGMAVVPNAPECRRVYEAEIARR